MSLEGSFGDKEVDVAYSLIAQRICISGVVDLVCDLCELRQLRVFLADWKLFVLSVLYCSLIECY